MRLYITGAPGSGKTTAAARIAKRHGMRPLCLDDIVWDNESGMRHVRAAESARDAALRSVAAEPAWIVEGSYGLPWMRPILERADCVIILNTSPALRMLRLAKRHFICRSPFAAPVDNFRLFVSNLRWGLTYEQGPLPELISLLELLGTPFHLYSPSNPEGSRQ
jgi:hypothetical protein